MESLARSTFTPGVLSDIGSFGGLFRARRGTVPVPVLVCERRRRRHQAQGRLHDRPHDTVGEDLVNHCVNDILVQGAEPLFFLDYLATGRLSPASPSRSSRHRAALPGERLRAIGGETAEMPGSTPTANTTSPASSSASSSGRRSIDGRGDRCPATCCSACLDRPAHQRLLAGARCLSRSPADARHIRHGARQHRRRGAAAPHRSICADPAAARSAVCQRAWRTSPAAASPRTCRACCPRAAPRRSICGRGEYRRCSSFCRARRHLDRRDVPGLQHGHRSHHRLRRARRPARDRHAGAGAASRTRVRASGFVVRRRARRCTLTSNMCTRRARRANLAAAEQQPAVDHRCRRPTGGLDAEDRGGRDLESSRGRGACSGRATRGSRRCTSTRASYPDRDAYDAALAGALQARTTSISCASPASCDSSAPPLLDGISQADPEHPPVAAAGRSRARRAAAGARARRARHRRDRASA